MEETSKLVSALRKPQQVRAVMARSVERVAELAGMTSYCDFTTQSSVRDSDGNLLRPDMVVSLPNGREIVIDAKTNIEAYLALEAKTPDDSEFSSEAIRASHARSGKVARVEEVLEGLQGKSRVHRDVRPGRSVRRRRWSRSETARPCGRGEHLARQSLDAHRSAPCPSRSAGASRLSESAEQALRTGRNCTTAPPSRTREQLGESLDQRCRPTTGSSARWTAA